MAFPYYDQVQRAYNELVSEGKIKQLPPGHQEEVEAQKGLLTMRAGYYSNQVDSNIGILEKTSGNNYKGYSVDILIHKNGDFWDIATDDGRQALPVNGGTRHDNELIPRWRQPTAKLAEVDNGDNGEPPNDDEIIERLEAMQEQLNAQSELLIAQGELLQQHTAKLDQILAKLNEGTGGGKFPIIYPDYLGRVLGFGVVLRPEPRENP